MKDIGHYVVVLYTASIKNKECRTHGVQGCVHGKYIFRHTSRKLSLCDLGLFIVVTVA